jgi:hypothetical protein
MKVLGYAKDERRPPDTETAADELPEFKPLMLKGLTYPEALVSMRATGCAIRRQHWCAPVVRLIDGKPHLDNEDEVEPFTPTAEDRRAGNWEMSPNPAHLQGGSER